MRRDIIDRTGETKVMNDGNEAIIIDYRNNHDIDVQFSDGSIVTHREYRNFIKGSIICPSKYNNRLGETNTMNNGLKATIVIYRKFDDIDVRFENGQIRTGVSYADFRNGKIACPGLLATQRVGESRRMQNGLMATIIQYENSDHVTVQFEN